MAVPFVDRRQIHIVAVDNRAELHRIGRTFESLALEGDVLMGNENILVEMLIEPGTITVHAASSVAEKMPEATEQRKDETVKNIVPCLRQFGVDAGILYVHVYRQFAGEPLQPRYHITLIREDIDMESLKLQCFGRATVFACGIIVAHLVALAVTQNGPFFIKSLVRLVVLQHILWMGVIFKVSAKTFKIFVVYHKINVVVPWNEASMADGTEDATTIETAGYSDLLSRPLEINRHIEEAELGTAKS